MAKTKPYIPRELDTFIKNDETTFQCDDGDWQIKIESRDDSDFKDELPAGAIMIAENGSGDCLFLKAAAGGTLDARVFVYWHEENCDEVFAKTIKVLVAKSNKNKDTDAKKPQTAKSAAPSMPVKEFENKLSKLEGHHRWALIREFQKGEFGLEALPLLRRLLAEDDASMAIYAAECIAKLGPEAATCEAGEEELPIADSHVDKGDLFDQLRHRGAKVWAYSGYANAYSACLNALLKVGYDPEYLCEYVKSHIGLSRSDLIHSLEALQAVGTSEAHDLAKRAAEFWMPELNKAETKKVNTIFASFGAKPKKKK
jgi:hypothetical protein